VKRQYLGRVGKVANGISTVHLSYVREGTGHALIGAREWIPTAHIGDPAASAVMGLPEELAFRTKGQLAIDILAEAVADGVRLDFVCGDEVSRSPSPKPDACSVTRPHPAAPHTGSTGGAATKPVHGGTASEHDWPAASRSPWSGSEWLLPY
jgi:DDE superfamily endonuclease